MITDYILCIKQDNTKFQMNTVEQTMFSTHEEVRHKKKRERELGNTHLEIKKHTFKLFMRQGIIMEIGKYLRLYSNVKVYQTRECELKWYWQENIYS